MPVVFLHGNNGFLQDFTLSVFPLLPRDWHAVAFDRPGYGHSDAPEHTPPTVEHQVEVLRQAFDALGFQRPVLVGHSWSGALILAYALRYPSRVSALVHVAGAAYPENSFWRPFLHLQKTVLWGHFCTLALNLPFLGWRSIRASIVDAFHPAQVPEEYLEVVASYWARPRQVSTAVRELATLEFTLERIHTAYSSISCATAIVVGECDALVLPEKHGVRLKAAIPHATLDIVKNAGHDLHFSHPESLVHILERLRPILKGDTRQ